MSVSTTARRTRAVLLFMMCAAGPVVFAIDLLARHFIVGSAPPDVQALMADMVTAIAWYAVPLPALGTIAGFYLYRSLYRKQRAAAAPDVAPEVAANRADVMALMIATTLAQLPALLGDISIMLGARFLPAICCTSISVAGVLFIGLVAPEKEKESLTTKPRREGGRGWEKIRSLIQKFRSEKYPSSPLLLLSSSLFCALCALVVKILSLSLSRPLVIACARDRRRRRRR